ncbi:chemotaxis response regulator protein-glutamate methylesterase [Fusibacter bizertensis]|jgi:Chemotaxis response regulator containing a CheY-like receiver domain and a methylesterase domain|uniref:Protein-glutamate methylesterase/protein-glutamine glutaminase n=1 Tax=Fusibacter bizertensis TaxID=1488331 RepID=A0ABT6N882_9FIRM|nr:chemotaxis response regulator protein-glutamate methylesterase [Fusibacter bizertensis]MDH8676608.1 chemotaxis response regulator protein-glutamate methylesterase [Fusibacter bizertensis]
MKIRVLVVDDSAFMRKVIADMISSDAGMEVVGTAKNGEEALQMIVSLKPAVVTMDVEMPKMDGLTALKQIMEVSPMPVIMLSSLTTNGAVETLKALDYGAFDFITKPTSLIKVSTPEVREELLSKIRIASRTKISKPSMVMRQTRPTPVVQKSEQSRTKNIGSRTKFKKLIAIGTSTGGPRALQDVIPYIPRDIDAGILIVQHMPPGFTKSLAERLDGMSQIQVKEAEDGDIICAGVAYLAPGDSHIKVTKQAGQFVIKLDNGDRVSGHKPSVDAMMYSIAELNDRDVIGVIMTGMGADGADGLVKVKANRGYIIAQDEESCVVFGMPKSTIKLGVVDKVVSLNNIANEIVKAMEV